MKGKTLFTEWLPSCWGRLVMVTLLAMAGFGQMRAQEAYAVLSTDGLTMTLYYDDLRSTREGTTFDSRGWLTDWLSGKNLCASATHVVIDPSMDNTQVDGEELFCCMKDLVSVTGLEYLHVINTTKEMFYGCESLQSLDLSHMDYEQGYWGTMDMMFSCCYSLKSVNLSNFIRYEASYQHFMRSAREMFYCCFNLTSVDVSGWKHVPSDLGNMFYHCSSLKTLDLSSWDLNVQYADIGSMFEGCSSLETIYVDDGWKDWMGVGNSSNVFKGCTSLVGGAGTAYDAEHVSGDWARVDGGTSKPGYLTPLSYAFYTEHDHTLHFRHDKLMPEVTGKKYNILNHRWSEMLERIRREVTRVEFAPSFAAARPTTTASWFSSMWRMTAIQGFEHLNTREVTDMSDMFNTCSHLTSLDVSGFDTQNVTNMHGMFSGCYLLTEIKGLDNFNTSQVTDMSSMFSLCEVLTSLDLSAFNTARLTNMASMFQACPALTEVNLSSFDTQQVTNMSFMFENCPSLTLLDLSSFQTPQVTDMQWMFSECSSLVTILAGSGWTTAAVPTDPWTEYEMFSGCTSLVGGNGTSYSSASIEYACIDALGTLGYFTDIAVVGEAVPYAVLSTDGATLTFYYDGMKGVRPGTKYDLPYTSYYPGWTSSTGNANITTANFAPSFDDYHGLTNTSYMFYRLSNLTAIRNISRLHTENVTSMDMMFYLCRNLDSLDVSHFNTENVRYMSGMFGYCHKIDSLAVSGFNTEKVEGMTMMFTACYGITNLDVRGFDTKNVRNMSYMFYACTNLSGIDVSGFNTENVTNMCTMFRDCKALTTLDVSHFNTEKVTNMNAMFQNCTNLRTIYCDDDWNTGTVTNSADMFTGCTNLVGGKGTAFDASHVDVAYARIDGGVVNPAYFTPTLPYGDVNRDGEVNITDVAAMVDIIVGKAPMPDPVTAIDDLSGDGHIALADLTRLVNLVLGR